MPAVAGTASASSGEAVRDFVCVKAGVVKTTASIKVVNRVAFKDVMLMVYCKYIKMLKKLLMESGISLLTISPEETSSYTWAATLPDNQERHAQQ